MFKRLPVPLTHPAQLCSQSPFLVRHRYTISHTFPIYRQLQTGKEACLNKAPQSLSALPQYLLAFTSATLPIPSSESLLCQSGVGLGSSSALDSLVQSSEVNTQLYQSNFHKNLA